MTYYLYCDGGGTPTVPTYFSYQLYENNKPAGFIFNNGITESIECYHFLCQNIPDYELPHNCNIVDDRNLGTNNLAEYMACYYALKRVKEVSGLMPLTVRQDSQLVINQVNGLWKCKKSHLISWLNAVNFIKWSEVKFEWVKRDIIVSILGH